MKPVIAIDGPAGSGKGTMARKLASHFGFAYLDTGVLYRTIAHMNVNMEKIHDFSIDDLLRESEKTPYEVLRSERVSAKASEIAKLPEVREVMTKLQRDFAAFPGDKYLGSVLDGRDIGTVVIPDATCKLFITASLKVRAMRRFDFIKQTNIQTTYREVYENLAARDEQDETRGVAPLAFNDSYILIDTSLETVEETFARTVKIVEEVFASAGVNT